MANNNVQNVKFLRNGSLFPTREAARTGMEGQLASLADGTVILGRYGTQTSAETLVGFVYNDGTNKSLTIFDIEGTSAETANLIAQINAKLGDGITSSNTVEDQLGALSGTSSDTSATTSVAGAKKYADEKVAELKESLDYTGYVVDENKVVTNITQTDGIVAASGTNVTGIKIGGYEVGSDAKVAADDTVGQAFGKLQGQINAMNVTDTAVSGSYVSQVTETEGKISVTRAELPSLTEVSSEGKAIVAVGEVKGQVSASFGNINAQYVETNTTGKDFQGATVQAALEEISSKVRANTITSTDNTVNVTTSTTGTDIAVNIDGTTIVKDSSTGVISSGLKIKSIAQADNSAYASQYQLVYGDTNTPIGETIDIPKDQFLKSVNYEPSTQILTLEMWNETGGTTSSQIDFSTSIVESEAGDGLYVTDHAINVGIDTTSEKVTTAEGTLTDVLTVSADSIKVQGIQAAIDYKVSTLKADLSGQSETIAAALNDLDEKKLSRLVFEEYSAVTNASISDLTAEIAARKAVDGQSGQTYVANASAKYISGATTLNDADVKLNDALKTLDGETVKTVKVNDVALAETSNAVNVKITPATGAGTGTTAITVNTDASGNITLGIGTIDAGTY